MEVAKPFGCAGVEDLEIVNGIPDGRFKSLLSVKELKEVCVEVKIGLTE